MKKTSVKILLLFLVLLILLPTVLLTVWGVSLIKCEVLTNKYYADFEYAYQGNSMLGDMEYFKVLECDGDYAEVYYVAEDRKGASVLTFEKQGGAWVEVSWRVIWSRSGSASDVIYPYLWHFIYGGF